MPYVYTCACPRRTYPGNGTCKPYTVCAGRTEGKGYDGVIYTYIRREWSQRKDTPPPLRQTRIAYFLLPPPPPSYTHRKPTNKPTFDFVHSTCRRQRTRTRRCHRTLYDIVSRTLHVVAHSYSHTVGICFLFHFFFFCFCCYYYLFLFFFSITQVVRIFIIVHSLRGTHARRPRHSQASRFFKIFFTFEFFF